MLQLPAARRAAWLVVAACAPSLLTLALAALFWKAGPRDFTTLWNDETVYWNEAAAFMRAGFAGGYITVDERPAAASFSRFGPHGPAFAVLYGSIGRLAGWRTYSPYLIHLLLVPLCAGAWLWVVRHRLGRLSAALLVVGFWPLLYYLPSSMQDPLHFGLAFLLAAVVESRLSARWRTVWLGCLLAIACVTRPTWALAIPALMWGRSAGTWRRLLSVPIAVVVFIAAFIAVTRAAAPYPATSWITEAVSDPVRGIPALFGATVDGAVFYVASYTNWVVVLLRIQTVIGLIAALFLWRRNPPHRWRIEVAVLLVLLVLAAMLPAGDVGSGREFHIVAPHMLAAVLIAAGAGGRWVKVPAAVNLLLLPTVMFTYHDHHDGRFAGTADTRRFTESVRGLLAFDEHARSGWDNTVLMHADLLQPPLQGLPHGIGISFVLDWEDQPMPPRSKYLLLAPRDEGQVRPHVRLVRVAETPLGVLYRNEEQTPADAR